MPDPSCRQAIDLIDEAGSVACKTPHAANLRDLHEPEELQRAKEEAVETQRFDDAIDCVIARWSWRPAQ